MENFLIYFSGWVIFVICYYIYNICRSKNKYSKKQILYHGIKWGIFSWIGLLTCVIGIIVAYISYSIFRLDDWIEDKLK